MNWYVSLYKRLLLSSLNSCRRTIGPTTGIKILKRGRFKKTIIVFLQHISYMLDLSLVHSSFVEITLIYPFQIEITPEMSNFRPENTTFKVNLSCIPKNAVDLTDSETFEWHVLLNEFNGTSSKIVKNPICTICLKMCTIIIIKR